jgi:hypothetical protein
LASAHHEREARSAPGNGEPIGAFHLNGGQNFHAKSLVRAPYPEAFPMPREVQPPMLACRLIYLPIS